MIDNFDIFDVVDALYFTHWVNKSSHFEILVPVDSIDLFVGQRS